MSNFVADKGCTIEVSNRGDVCGLKDVCEICKLCAKHCLEHYMCRFGFRMVKTSDIQKSDFKSE